MSHFVDILRVSRLSAVDYDDTVEGGLFVAQSRKSHFYCHCIIPPKIDFLLHHAERHSFAFFKLFHHDFRLFELF